ncbi:hypothetical protein FZW96_07955 [Bacillus sp. BGMRC 2118]|nr:hypothetical protein FZW96_07955 [Bacillus sp. BGMRC 2118]
MFEIKTYIQSRFDVTHKERYISLEDEQKIREFIGQPKFTPEHIKMLITIKYNDEVVLGIDGPSGLDLWSDTYMAAIEGYLSKGEVEILYGIDPVVMILKPVDSTYVEFIIKDEWQPSEIYAKAKLPRRQFFEALLDGAEQFWKTLICHKVFEEKELRETTPRDYPDVMIRKTNGLREQLIIS